MNSKPLNILVFGQSFLGKIGGVQQSYAWLYKFLCQKGHKITHVTHLPIGEHGLYYQFPKAVCLRSINIMFARNIQDKICRLTKEIDPDVVLVVNSGAQGCFFSLALRQTPYPVILSERGSPEYCIKSLWKSRRFYELGAYCADFKHILMSSYTLALPQELRDRVRIISSLTMPAFIFAQADKAAKNGKFRILYTGRFSPEKRLPLLVEAFAMVAAQFPEWEMILVGDGPERPAIEACIEEHKLVGRIVLPGYVESPDKLAEHYAAAHIFALPSSAEGCPLALREAMAHGLPVLGFQTCPGTNEIIVHEHNGLLAAEDTPSALAACLRRLMAEPGLRVQYAWQGRQDVERFAPEKTHAAWEALLYEGAAYKGHKKRLWWRRVFRHPWRYLYYAAQIWSLERGNLRRDIFARSPLHWLRGLRGSYVKFSIINMLPAYFRSLKGNDNSILNYDSRIIHHIKNASKCEKMKLADIALRIISLSIRHGIDMNRLYGPLV
ncbi:hypothetical protein CE91St38_07800 [Desulfovibrionaceae bacterium]|nr:hypothetical protein CE91St38_07800 [Desulfovibrionaceae bacterium]GKI11323.1 hypothetical protein CE91St39_07770 [Desulfovibrionaceae bacterium]